MKRFTHRTIVLSTVIVVLGLITTVQLAVTNQLNIQQNILKEEVKTLQERNDKLSNDLDLTLSDTIIPLGNSKTEKYSFGEFGVYSSLFENKDMIIRVYRYRARNIISKQIILSDDNNQKVSIESFQFDNTPLKLDYGELERNYAAIERDEWEHRVTIPELKAQWKEKYTNPDGIEFYSTLKLIRFGEILSQDNYQPQNGVLGHPVLFRISYSLHNNADTGAVSIVVRNNAQKELKAIADSITSRI
jgi:hypothetical protein